MKVLYTAHLEFRMKVREIPHDLPRKVFEESKEHYYDTHTDHCVALSTVTFKNKSREMARMEENMSKKPLVNYDSASDVLYIVTKKGAEEESVEVAPGIHVELDEKGEVIGIEILNASAFFKPVAKPLYRHMQMT